MQIDDWVQLFVEINGRQPNADEISQAKASGEIIDNNVNESQRTLIGKFYKQGSILDKLHLLWILVAIVLLLSTLLNIIKYPDFGGLSIYKVDMGKAGQVLFLLSFVEIFFLLRKNAKIFIPLRLINFIIISTLLSGLETQISESDRMVNAIGFFAFKFIESQFGFSPPFPEGGTEQLLPTFHVIRFLSIISIVILVVYLYYWIIKKKQPQTNPYINVITFSDMKNIYAINPMVFIASVLLMTMPILNFRGFVGTPLITFPVLIFAMVIIYLLPTKNEKKLNGFIYAEIATMIILNPLLLFANIGINIGYIAYVIGIILLVVHVFKQKRKINPLNK